ncbi:Rid family hydrolase [Paenirhodobacter populi]|uniref:Rid family hydrolase n=1 Tax=Paenirhodobacter populi TaxID=2306993 RepID=UPI001F5028F5|nr:Rid family hydrolase [Sinirhodobacter populi]
MSCTSSKAEIEWRKPKSLEPHGAKRAFHRTINPEQQFGAFMEVKKAVFPQAPYPTWTAVGVNWLAGFDVEIKVIARVP